MNRRLVLGLMMILMSGISALGQTREIDTVLKTGQEIQTQESIEMDLHQFLNGDLALTRSNGWQEFNLLNIDGYFNIINQGVDRFFCELNGRRFILTDNPQEVESGDFIFPLVAGDTTLINIFPYLNPGFFETTGLRILLQGEIGSSAIVIVGDQSALLKDSVDYVLTLDKYTDGDANRDGFIHEKDDQFVELVNGSNREIDISGWELTVGAGRWHQFPENTTLQSGEFIVVFGGGMPIDVPGLFSWQMGAAA